MFDYSQTHHEEQRTGGAVQRAGDGETAWKDEHACKGVRGSEEQRAQAATDPGANGSTYQPGASACEVPLVWTREHRCSCLYLEMQQVRTGQNTQNSSCMHPKQIKHHPPRDCEEWRRKHQGNTVRAEWTKGDRKRVNEKGAGSRVK